MSFALHERGLTARFLMDGLKSHSSQEDLGFHQKISSQFRQSCAKKVFVGTWVDETQELTNHDDWHFMDTKCIPANDVSHGKKLVELSISSRPRGSHRAKFPQQPPEEWPAMHIQCKQPTSRGVTSRF